MSFKHTPETDLRIRVGYAMSLPVQDIADALGVTKNVVIGRAGRIGLAGTYDLQISRQRGSDKVRARSRIKKPRPKMQAWWASRPADERAAHIAKLRAGRTAKVNTAHKLQIGA